MKKNLFIALLLSFLFSTSFADELRCDNQEQLKNLGFPIIKRIFNRYTSFLNPTDGYTNPILGASEVRNYENDFMNYLLNDVKLEFSSIKTIKTGATATGTKIHLCTAKISITFPEPPKSVRIAQETRVRYNRVREMSVDLKDLIESSFNFKTAFNGDTHEIDNVRYQIRQGNNPELITQPIDSRFGHYIDPFD